MNAALVTAAMDLGSRGFRILPTRAKVPVVNSWPTRATAEPNGVQALFREFPNADGLGIATGNGFFVLDGDTYKPEAAAALKDLEENHGALPATIRAITGGGGTHWYFRVPDGVRVKTVRGVVPGFDVRGDGGQVVAPPSPHKSGTPYRWAEDCAPWQASMAYAPDWLLDLVRDDQPKTAPAPRSAAPTGDASVIERARRYIDKMAPAIEGSGGSDAAMAVAVALVRGFALSEDDAFALMAMNYNPRCQPPWSEKELRHKIKSAANASRVGWGYLRDSERDDSRDPRRPGPQRTKPHRVPDRDPEPVTPATPAAPGDIPPDETTPDAPPATVTGLWQQRLSLNAKGRPYDTLGNVVLALTYAPEWQGVFAYDEFRSCIVVRAPLPAGPDYRNPRSGDNMSDEPISDTDPKRVAIWLEREADIRVSPGVAYDAIDVVARARPFNPVQDRLGSLVWDGVERLNSWLVDYLGVECHTPEAVAYTSAVGSWWMISAAARVFRPGCKVDHVLTLDGGQGEGKSTVARILSLGWFNDSEIDLNSKDSYINLRGHLVVEIAELDGFTRHEAARIKQFLTSSTDTYRPPYGRESVKIPRQCVFIATVNPAQYLRDDTGGRRFWPVTVSGINLDALERDAEQLWAEAVARFREGGVWYPRTKEEHSLCAIEQRDRQVSEPWGDTVSEWIASARRRVDYTGWLTPGEILKGALDIPEAKHDMVAHARCERVLVSLGWKKKRCPYAPGRARRWHDPEAKAEQQDLAV